LNNVLSSDINRRNNSRLINRINQLDLDNCNVSKAKSVVQDHKKSSVKLLKNRNEQTHEWMEQVEERKGIEKPNSKNRWNI